MDMKHTPGPWRVLPLGDRKYYGTEVALGDLGRIDVWLSDYERPSVRELARGWDDDYGMDHVESQATYEVACLIAAAPELLEACQLAQTVLRRFDPDHPAAKAVRIAIAKATGQ